MENKFSKMMFAFVAVLALSVSTVSATWVNVQVTAGSYAGEISWSLNDASGTSMASTTAGYYSMTGVPVDYWVNTPDGCYTIELYDSWGDGWNGGTYQIIDSTGTVYSSGGLITGSLGVDNVSINATCTVGCTDPTATNYDPLASIDDGSCTYGCAGNALLLSMTDVYGDGWNGNVWNLYDLSGNVVATGTLLSGSAGTESFCIPDGCYTLSCDNGSWQSEVGWTLTDTAGTVVASGGAPDAQNLNLNSSCSAGCTDMFASNYDPTAVFDDGSCLYPGCLDPLATNYCASCNVNDSLSCVFPVCNALDFSDNFEAANLTGNGWTTLSGAEASVALTTANAIADTVSLEFTGGSYIGFNFPYSSEADAFGGSPDHVSSATLCLDMSGSAATVNMTIDAELVSYYTSTYGWFRVRIAGDTVGTADVAGNAAYNNATLTGVNTLTYDLSAYANQSSVYVTFEAVCKYGPSYNALVADYVRVDNINVFNVYPCTYYAASATGTDASCNAGSDGTATCAVSSPNATSDTYLWSDGQTTPTATGLAAGTYTCTTTDALNGCTATASVTIGEPSALALTAVVVDATSPIANDGSVDLSVAGGTPCYSGSNTVSGAAPNNSYGGNAFNVIASADLGISSLDLFCQAGLGDIDVYYRNGSAEGNELNASAWTHAAYQGNMQNVAGLVNVPVSISANAGDTIGIYVICSDGMQYTSGNAPAYTQVIASDANLAISNGTGLGTYIAFSGSVFGPPNGARDFAGNVNYGTASYTYAWSTGAATEDVSGLGMGPVSCTVTDCNGCTATWSGFVMVNITPGCTDTLASNYNPAANQDDGSCTYPGCTDSVATNFDASANLDDGSCTYSCDYYGYDDEITITYDSDFFADETSWQIINANGDTVAASVPYATGYSVYVTTACVNDGCFTIEMQDSWGDGWGYGSGGIMVQNSNGDTLIAHATINTGSVASDIFGVNSSCIVGCMDPIATNFDATATIMDSTACVYCTDNMITLNMYDSWGDGWNGNSFVMSDVILGSTVAAATLSGGSVGSETFCLIDGCYNIVVDYGSFQSEVSWDLVDAAGNILLSGGAPFSGNITLGANTVCATGCMDPLANNYDPTAVLADSCAYVGCMDMSAVNYSATSNVNDSTLCIYPGCGSSLPYAEDFSSGMGADVTLGWTAGGSISSVDSTNNGTFSWHGQGDSYIGWNSPYSTGFDAFSYSPDHIASGSLCMDLTAYAGQSIMMTFDLRQTYSFNSTYSWFRVTDGTNVLASSSGADYFQPATADSDPWYNVSYDLSALAGTQATIVFESCGKYYDDYYQGGDNSFVDNINIDVAITPVYGCTDSTASNYNAAANTDDGSCISCGAGYAYVNINCDNGSFQSEVSWNLVDAAGTTVLSGGAPFNLDTCLADGCYSLDMTDSWGDGWNGNVFAITEAISGVSTTATLATGFTGTASLSAASLGCYIYGCTDPLATNYDATANTDDGSCSYATCVTSVPYTEDFETGMADMTLTAAAQASSTVDSSGNNSAFAWHGQGGGAAGWLFPYGTGPEAFNSVTHIATSSLCVDLTAVAAGTPVSLAFDLRQEFSFNATYSWFRVNVDTTVLTNSNGDQYYSPLTACADAWATHTIDLSAYVGQSIDVEFQSCGKYYDDYYNCGDNSYVDNINLVSDIYGCTDPLANNYNSAATVDDGSCAYPCTDNALVLNMVDSWGDGWNGNLWTMTDPLGNVVATSTLSTGSAGTDTLCIADGCYTIECGGGSFQSEVSWDLVDASGAIVLSGGASNTVSTTLDLGGMCAAYGCTDPTASNYSATATIDDGSCNYACLDNEVVMGMFDSYGDGWNGSTYDISTGGVSVATGGLLTGYFAYDTLCLPTGCYDVTVGGGSYLSEVSFNFGSLVGAAAGTYTDISVGGAACGPILGCTDSTAMNYDPAATQDDGSCTYCVGTYANISVGGGTYMSEVSWTLTDGAGNTVLTGGAPFSLDTCLADDCYTVDMVDSWGDGWNGSTFDLDGVALGTILTGSTGSFTFSTGSASCAVLGCTDPLASNYDATATVDDGSCVYPCTDNEVAVNMYDSWGDGWNGGTYDISTGGASVATGGLTSGSYGSDTLCLPTGCYDVTVGGGWYDSEISFDFGSLLAAAAGTYTDVSVGGAVCGTLGCTDALALNYDSTATIDDGSCVYCVDGCTDPTALNYDSAATCDDGSCIAIVYGCTDPNAFNYYAGANVDDGSCCLVAGCTDPTASNYNASACIDDGSCTIVSTCTSPSPTGAYVSELIHDRARINWDNMNDANCMVDQYRIRYREAGTSSWSSKTMAGSGLCIFGLNTTSKKILGLTPSTTYEYYMKAWYCGGGVSGWSAIQNFTTADECPNVINFAASSPTTTKATFTWDTTAAYSFVRVKLRVDTLNAAWTTAGGFGVFYPALTKNKNGLTPGQPYRASARTWCDPAGGTYRSAGWTSPIFWTQPTSIRVDGGTAINNLDVYPNPSRDIFNVTFTSEDTQDLDVRIINVVGEVVYTENLEQFVGEYTKAIDLATYTKGVYFLEITTNNGVVNKKLILQ